MSSLFAELPLPLIHHIISYTNKIYYHKGRYIQKINVHLPKYTLLFTIPRPVQIDLDKYNLYLINKKTLTGYILHYSVDVRNRIILLHVFFHYNTRNQQSICEQDTVETPMYVETIRYDKTVERYIMPDCYSRWRRITSYETLNRP
jgi:hypothetical protein